MDKDRGQEQDSAIVSAQKSEQLRQLAEGQNREKQLNIVQGGMFQGRYLLVKELGKAE